MVSPQQSLWVLSTVIGVFAGGAFSEVCHICDYTKADSCEHAREYKLVDCQDYWSGSKYCLKVNGTRNVVRQDGAEMNATGIHRSCHQESDWGTFGLLPDLQPGCRSVHVLNKNTSLYKSFMFDGVICICDGAGCNRSDKLRLGVVWKAFFAVLLLSNRL
ncbi:hypothetical protein BV898_01620 [Hypsibius exemplaris]|uniref:Protein quiver n=1 Tax=Hypsibius exemplaris TaxID=2072580 RepID=A0A1W0XAW4_HYPEX|nr:hypothetical protein BV898_01620 [Hypsibius exemplaris]